MESEAMAAVTFTPILSSVTSMATTMTNNLQALFDDRKQLLVERPVAVGFGPLPPVAQQEIDQLQAMYVSVTATMILNALVSPCCTSGGQWKTSSPMRRKITKDTILIGPFNSPSNRSSNLVVVFSAHSSARPA